MAEVQVATLGVASAAPQEDQLDKEKIYRDGAKMVEQTKETENKTRKLQADTVGKAMNFGIISNRTGADAVTYEGTNPFAVAQVGEDMFLTFRRKSMAVIILQSIFVNAIAFAVDRYAPLPEFHWGLYLATWIIPLILLGILSCIRYKTPCNFVMLFIFSVAVGITFGLLHEPMKAYTENFATDRKKNWSPQCYGMAGHTIALILLSLLTCFKHPGRQPGRAMVKMAPVSILVAVVTDIAGIIAYATYWNYIGPTIFIVISIVMNTLSLMWIGYQMDALALRLKLDEWLYPLILLWCEVFVTLFIVAAVMFMIVATCVSGGAQDVGILDGGCAGCYGFYCDCYYGGSGDEERRNSEDTAQDQPPVQEGMVSAVDV
eukprot:TRINITY_DN27066_c0_g1_i1.p1 TRINITY_DN27066_c0_g1~~TRINITY_DN27066_c0_g1_i1.p1  ORF type:complete len:375 (+),score=50.47 TRINITY_DN27066_c0_g1_i1:115-1239(+)